MKISENGKKKLKEFGWTVLKLAVGLLAGIVGADCVS